jgi:hypothetical protein
VILILVYHPEDVHFLLRVCKFGSSQAKSCHKAIYGDCHNIGKSGHFLSFSVLPFISPSATTKVIIG